MEYNPMEEMGLTEEKQLVMSCNGILSSNDYVRRLCERTVRNGGHFYDVLSRYDDLARHALNRDEVPSAMKIAIPVLRAYGVTDNAAFKFAKDDLKAVPGSKETVAYLRALLPTFLVTSSFEHHVIALSDALEMPMENFSYTRIEFDDKDVDRGESKRLREIAGVISSLRIPKTMYSITEPEFLEEEDVKILDTLDEILTDILPNSELGKAFSNTQIVGSNEKAYSLLEIRRKTEIEFNSTAYIGSDMNDYQALDLIHDSEGLAVSYNGGEYAVQGCNIAVMSSNNIVLDVLVGEFYNEGIQAVFDMVENWDRKYLESHKCSDRNLMDRMLGTFPKKLPVVKKVDRNNVKETVEESTAYRRKVRY